MRVRENMDNNEKGQDQESEDGVELLNLISHDEPGHVKTSSSSLTGSTVRWEVVGDDNNSRNNTENRDPSISSLEGSSGYGGGISKRSNNSRMISSLPPLSTRRSESQSSTIERINTISGDNTETDTDDVNELANVSPYSTDEGDDSDWDSNFPNSASRNNNMQMEESGEEVEPSLNIGLEGNSGRGGGDWYGNQQNNPNNNNGTNFLDFLMQALVAAAIGIIFLVVGDILDGLFRLPGSDLNPMTPGKGLKWNSARSGRKVK